MTKYVRETAAGKSISALVILNPKGKHVATVQAYYGNSGRVLVNVWHAYQKGKETPEMQHASAGGYGYDKFTAALSGLIIDGHTMSNHCSREGAPKYPKGRNSFPSDFKPPKGYSLANWADGSKTYPDTGARVHSRLAPDESGYSDCYRKEGLKYLEAIGYQVITAI
jgi:hypothetical protein